MKLIHKILLLVSLVAILSFALPGSVEAATPADDKIVFGGTYTLESGQTLDGNLAIFGGTATIESGATVQGDVILAGGTVTVNGTVDGSLVLFGGSAFLETGSHVRGDISKFGAALHQADGAQVDGSIRSGSGEGLDFDVPDTWIAPSRRIDLNPIWDLFGFFARTFAMAALAIFIVLLAPNASDRAARAAGAQPIIAGGLGFLTALLAVPVIILLTITILLIPVSLLVILLLILAVTFGWIILGLLIGKKVAELFKASWPLPISAGIGTLILSFVANAIGFIPCVGWMAPFLVTIVGLGAVLLTRFGTLAYPLNVEPAGAPPIPPVNPPAPVRPTAPVPPTPPAPVTVYPVDEPQAPRDEPPSMQP